MIDIPTKEYNNIIKGRWEGNPLADYIENGTPLPKRHGRLIDAKVTYRKFYSRCYAGVAEEILNEVPTIIEADKGESEE